MPMIEAAPSAASNASAERVSPASSAISRKTVAFFVAAAAARKVPHSCCSLSSVERASELRLSLRSFAYSGSAFLRLSIDIFLDAFLQQLTGVDGRVALLPVAGAQLVRLESIEDAQHLVDVAADGTCGDGDELDLVVGVNDEGRAVGNSISVEHAGRFSEFTLEVREDRERQRFEIFVLCTPLEVDELVVDGCAKNLRVAVRELLVELAESGNLGGADEGEVLRPEEDDAPLSSVVVAGDSGEVIVRLLSVNLRKVATDHGGQVVRRELVADGEQSHYLFLLGHEHRMLGREQLLGRENRVRGRREARRPQLLWCGSIVHDHHQKVKAIGGLILIGMADQTYQPTLSQLRAFVAVAEYRHFGTAATRLNVSQPTLSQALAALENGLGVQLIERSTRRVLVTDAGERLLGQAKMILEAAEGFIASAAGASGRLAGPLRMGLIPTVAPYVLPAFLPALADKMPALTLHVVEDQTARLLEALRVGALDVAVLALPTDAPGVVEIELYAEDFVLVTPPNHPLAHRTDIAPAVLDGLPLLLLDEGHCLRDQTLDLCRSVEARPVGGDTRATSLSTVVQCVAGGLGVTLVPRSALRVETGRAELASAQFAEPAPGRTIGLVFRTSSARAEDYRELAELLKSVAPVN